MTTKKHQTYQGKNESFRLLGFSVGGGLIVAEVHPDSKEDNGTTNNLKENNNGN